MSTNFPTSLDTFTNPSGTDLVSSEIGTRTHSEFHSDNNDALEALEAKVGVDSSAVTTSHDYKLSGVTGSDKAASKTGTETLTNKTLTSPTLNSPTISTPTISSVWNFGAHTAYFTETDNGNSSTADTIDWTLSNKQKSTLTGNCTFTFTAPTGPCNLLLKLVQDGTGSRTVTWPAAVHWSGGVAPTLTTTASKVDIITFYYDGATYFGSSILNFTA